MANIITSKTRKKINRREGVKYSSSAFKRQWRGQQKGENSQEFLFEKRVLELHQKGFLEDAIIGMMHGTKGTGERGAIKNIIRKGKKGIIKLDGLI